MAGKRKTPALNDGHTLHLADEYHPDHRIAAAAADAKAREAAYRYAHCLDDLDAPSKRIASMTRENDASH